MQGIAEKNQGCEAHLDRGHAGHATAVGMTARDRTPGDLLDEDWYRPLGFGFGQVDRARRQLARL